MLARRMATIAILLLISIVVAPDVRESQNDGRQTKGLEFADRVLCELGRPDLLHQLEDVTAGTIGPWRR